MTHIYDADVHMFTQDGSLSPEDVQALIKDRSHLVRFLSQGLYVEARHPRTSLEASYENIVFRVESIMWNPTTIMAHGSGFDVIIADRF